jgi:predicted ATP-grasp superfamily ATP-dependent carboligase
MTLASPRLASSEESLALRYPQVPPRVLVLGITPSLTWAVARCLARAGMRPVVVGYPRLSPLMLSRDFADYEPLVRAHWIDGELDLGLIHQVERAAYKYDADVVVPADYDSTMLLARAGHQLTRARPCVLPDPATILALHDKWELFQLLQRLGIPCPATELAATAEDLARTSLPFPIITKPPAQSASVGFQVHRSRQGLEATLAEGNLAAGFPVLVQQFAPGWDIGFSFLARRGRLVAYSISEHKRNGHRRFYDDPRLRRHMERLLEATRYSGVGHVDGRYDPDRDDVRILELNPRFWGSLLYSTNAGVNYPELLVRLDDPPASCVQTARPGHVVLPPYERGMAVTMNVCERAYQRTFRALGI